MLVCMEKKRNAYNILVIKFHGIRWNIWVSKHVGNIKMDFPEIGHVKMRRGLVWLKVL